MLVASTLLLCALPLLIVVTALAGRSAATGIGRRMGLNAEATAHFGHLFATPGAASAAVIGTTSMVFFVLGGTAGSPLTYAAGAEQRTGADLEQG